MGRAHALTDVLSRKL